MMLEPAEQLVQDLEMLRRKLNELKDRLNDSGVERTYHLRRIMGQNCQSYRKSLDLFESEDYEDIRKLVKDLSEVFDVVEGKLPNE